MALSNSAKAGAAMFLGATQFIIGVNLAEFYYPGYNVSVNAISDLGANCTPNPCQINEPTSLIFTTTVFILGLAGLAAAYYLQKGYRQKNLTAMVGIASIGILGVAIFPETTGIVHHLFSLIAFLFGGLAAIVSYRLQRPPLSYASVVLGLITLGSLVLYAGSVYLGLGQGGMERMIAYPALLWFIGFGGLLMAMDDPPAQLLTKK